MVAACKRSTIGLAAGAFVAIVDFELIHDDVGAVYQQVECIDLVCAWGMQG